MHARVVREPILMLTQKRANPSSILAIVLIFAGSVPRSSCRGMHHSSSSGLNPIRFLFSAGGSISWRIASNNPMMASS